MGIGDMRGQGGEAERGQGDRNDMRRGQGKVRGDRQSERGQGTILPQKGNRDGDSVWYQRC